MDLKTAGEFTAKLIGYFGVVGFTYAMMYLLSCGYYAIFPIFSEMSTYVLEKYPDLSKACNRKKCTIYAELLKRAYVCGEEKETGVEIIRKSLKKIIMKTLLDRETCIKDKIKIFVFLYIPQFYIKLKR